MQNNPKSFWEEFEDTSENFSTEEEIQKLPIEEPSKPAVKEEPNSFWKEFEDSSENFIVEEESPKLSTTKKLPEPTTADTFEIKETDEDAQVSFSKLASDEDYMELLREYGDDNKNSMGVQKERESNYDYVKRFLHHTRDFEWNTIDLGQQVDYLRTASIDDRRRFGYLYNQAEKLPSFYEDGGTGTLNAVKEFGAAILTDPLSYVGFGTGFVARKLATRAVLEAFKTGGKKAGEKELKKYAFKKMLGTTAGKTAAGGVVAETGVGVVQNLGLQETANLSQKMTYDGIEVPDGYDFGEAAVMGGLGLAFGGLGYKLSGGLSLNSIRGGARSQRLKQKLIEKEYKTRSKKEQGELASALSDEATKDTVNGIFDLNDGKKALENLGDNVSELAQITFNTELMKRVGKVVTNVVSDLASNGQLVKMVDEDTKAMEVIGDVVIKRLKSVQGKSSKEIAEGTKDLLTGESGLLKTLDVGSDKFDDALEGAIAREGLSVEQFANAMGASYSDAGSILSTASQVGKIMKRLGRIDPVLEDILKASSSAEKIAGPMGRLQQFYYRADRERRALMVSGPATTIRNIATGAMRLTMQTAADSMESAIYQMSRGADAALTGNKAIGSGNIKDIITDSFGKLSRLTQITNTTSLADDLLRHNRNLAARMDKTLQEVSDDETLSAFARNMNSLNIAQDLFFRRGVFVDSIDKKLRRAGIIVNKPVGANQFKSLDEMMIAGKQLPSSVLADSIDDALEFTFTKMPDGNTLAAKFVKFTEAVGPLGGPIGTGAFPFARFMVNALKFQYDFSPVGGANTVISSMYRKATRTDFKSLANAATDIRKKTELNNKAVAQAQKSRESIAKSTMGTAAFAAAINYRADNQDVKFYEYRAEDGTIGDLRPFFPLAPYLAVADLFVKYGNGDGASANIKEVLSTVAGVQSRTGASSYVLDNFGESFSAISGDGTDTPSTERVGELLGGYIATLGAGFLTPGRVVRDIQASYDTEAAVLRDAKPVNGVGIDERFFSALRNNVYKDLPGAAKLLPAMESPTREQDVYRMSPLAGQIGVPRKEATRNAVENELVRLGIERYTVGGKTGDKTADAFVNKNLGRLSEKYMGDFVESPRYKNLSDTQKRVAFGNKMKLYRSIATETATVEASIDAQNKGIASTPFDRAKYGRLTNNQTRLIDNYYKEKYGKPVLEMVEEEENVNHYLRATELAKFLAKRY